MQRIATHGVWLGLVDDISDLLENDTIELQEGDTILLYTDGITEMRLGRPSPVFATGLPRLMVVTANTCSGPRAYVGLASSYFERTTGDFERLTDQSWASEVMDSAPEDPPWLRDVIAR